MLYHFLYKRKNNVARGWSEKDEKIQREVGALEKMMQTDIIGSVIQNVGANQNNALENYDRNLKFSKHMNI